MGEEAALVSLATVFIEKGVDAMPIISTVLLVIVMWFYRKDGRTRDDLARADLVVSIQAIERNTAALQNISEVTRVRMENPK